MALNKSEVGKALSKIVGASLLVCAGVMALGAVGTALIFVL